MSTDVHRCPQNPHPPKERRPGGKVARLSHAVRSAIARALLEGVTFDQPASAAPKGITRRNIANWWSSPDAAAIRAGFLAAKMPPTGSEASARELFALSDAIALAQATLTSFAQRGPEQPPMQAVAYALPALIGAVIAASRRRQELESGITYGPLLAKAALGSLKEPAKPAQPNPGTESKPAEHQPEDSLEFAQGQTLRPKAVP